MNAAIAPQPSTDRLRDARGVMLTGEVTDESSHVAIARLLALSADDPDSDIALVINSPGGSVIDGLAVYDVMRLIPNDVVTIAAGLAASMGQILLCAGTAGKRFVLPNAQVLMHEGSAGIGGSAADVEIQAEHLVATLDRMRRIISHHTGRSLDEVARDVGRDLWFDADEAVDYGFADAIVHDLGAVLPGRSIRRVGLVAASNGADR